MRANSRKLLLVGALALAFPIASGAQGMRDHDDEGFGPSFALEGGMMQHHGMMPGGAMHGGPDGVGRGMMRGASMKHGGGHRAGPMMHLRALDLTEAQRDKIFGIMHAQAPTMRDKHKAIRKAREELRTLAHGDGFDAGKARAASDTLGKAVSEMALLRAQTHAQVHAVLTPDQRKKAEALHQEKGPQGGPGRRWH